jgi:phage-related protein
MWRVEYLDELARDEVETLPRDMLAKFIRLTDLVREHGLDRLREPSVKHLEDKLWEMRLSGRDGIARSLYMTAVGRRVIVLRTFVKKTQKTPRREIELALERAKRVK